MQDEYIECGVIRFVASTLSGSKQVANQSVSEWIPPEDPDPDAILTEAVNDTDARRYEDALAKHLWFYREALRYRPSLYGVRLSFALGYWVELGGVYPPAMRELEKIRDETGQRILNGKTNSLRDLFRDFQGINRALQTETETADLFIRLDRDCPDQAEQVFDVALAALLKSKEYKLCGKYLKPMDMIRRDGDTFRRHENMAKEPRYANKDFEKVGRQIFTNDASILVALLVVNDRKPEAEEVAECARKEWDDTGFRAALNKALTGEIPKPWP